MAPGAMKFSLITLQARSEVVNLDITKDIRDGQIYIIRDKTSGDSDMAFIKIPVTPAITRIIKKSKDGTHSPYLVHFQPQSRKRADLNKKPHWTYFTPSYLTHTFAAIRNDLAPFNTMPSTERPGFHEIRSLGARLYEEKGYPKDYIRMLMSPPDRKTTDFYLGGGELRDHHFVQVAADLDIQDL